MGRTCSTYGIIQKCIESFMGKPEGETFREDNIKMDLREMVCDPGNWIDLAQDRDQWRTYVGMTVMNLRVPLKPIGLLVNHVSYGCDDL